MVIALLFYSMMSVSQTDTSSSISAQIDLIDANKELSSEQKDTALALLTEALQLRDNMTARSKKVKSYNALAASAGESIKKLESEVQSLQSAPITVLPSKISNDYLESQLDKLQNNRAAEDVLLNSLLAQEGDLVTRAGGIVNQITTAREEVIELEASPIDEAPINPIDRAVLTHYDVKLAERKAAVTDLEIERDTLPVRQDLVAARIALTNANLTHIDKNIEPIQKRLGQKRINDSRAVALKTEKALLEPFTTPGLKKLAIENDNLAKSHLALVEQYSSSTGNYLDLHQELASVITASQTVEQILETGQLNDETANLLRVVESRLPNVVLLTEKIKSNSKNMISLRLNRILWQDRLRNLRNLDVAAKRLLTGYNEPTPSDSVLQEATKILAIRKGVLDALISSARDTIELQSDQNKTFEELRTRTNTQKNVLQRNFLWLPTRIEFGQNLQKNIYDNISWLMSLNKWYETGKIASRGYFQFNSVALLLAFLSLFFIIIRARLCRQLQQLIKQIGNVKLDTYSTTPMAMLLTIAIAMPLPLLIVSCVFAIEMGGSSSFSGAISSGLLASVATLFILNNFRAFANKNGVFQEHFQWSEEACALLRFHLLWFTITSVLVVFVFTAALASGSLTIKYGLGRLAFIVGAAAFAAFSYYFLRSDKGIVSKSISHENRIIKIQKILFFIFVVVPICIGMMPLFGYFEAAIVLQEKLFLSGVMLLLGSILYGLGIRSFLIGHRRLAFKRITQERQRKKEERELEQVADQSGDATPQQLDEEVVDLETLSKESIKSLNITIAVMLMLGLSVVWRSMLPAFGILNEIVLWEGTQYANGVAAISNVSLWNLIVAISFIVGGYVVAKNIRSVLELAVFERLDFDAGARYAAVTISGYVLIGIGIVSGFGQLGVDWSSMQWIVAALGVGLGFGLQEIVANFVSGLIILFERPVRVGDIVTVGELEGTVTSIKIRATRITDFDNKEVLMPNKSIITENVTNWTLSNQITRIKIQIGVAYGSDVDAVRDILFDIITKHPEALKHPAPAVFFLAHGDSALNFEARVFVASTAMRLPVTHELNRDINVMLTKHGIEIPFPQRDLHIKTDVPTEVVAVTEKDKAY